MRLPWRERKRNSENAIFGEEILTQYGNRKKPVAGRPFKNMPSAPDQKNAISLMKGQLTWDDAVTLFPGPRKKAINGEGVRYTTADRLIRAEFRVKFTPNPGNPLHVSVENLDVKRDWTDDDAERFDSCFDAPEWKEA